MQTLQITLICVCFLQSFSSCGQSSKSDTENKNVTAQTNEPPSCDCCVFDEVKSKTLSYKTRLAPDTVKGEQIRITGVVYKTDGKTPAANVKMYFYHTNSYGKYAKLGSEDKTSHAWWHGYCRGWLQTNERGEYEINSIKPVSYPNGNEPAHIHGSVLNADKSCSYLLDFVFKGDVFLNKDYWNRVRSFWKREGKKGNPEYEGVELTKNSEGLLIGKRNIILEK